MVHFSAHKPLLLGTAFLPQKERNEKRKRKYQRKREKQRKNFANTKHNT
jgi:hypothetical protein